MSHTLPTGRPPRSAGHIRRSNIDFRPIHFSKYFTTKEAVRVNEGDMVCTYNLSSKGFDLPLPNTANDEEKGCGCSGSCTYPCPRSLPLVIFLHGAGYSGLSWAQTASQLTSLVACHTMSYDLRGHGETISTDEGDLSIERLADDLLKLIRATGFSDNPLVFVGHSLGGSIAVHAALKGQEEYKILGVIVLDVVEGSAIDSLSSMKGILKNRPTSFSSLPKAVEWCMKAGIVRNAESARISIPGQLKNAFSKEPATVDLLVNLEVDEGQEKPSDSEAPQSTKNEISPKLENTSYIWRIDLNSTEQHWNSWFEGLSSKFLSVNCPKLLILAGVDRLDRELCIGQMQGKFQMQVLNKVGHCLHEDSPEEVAGVIGAFLCRNQLVEALGDVIHTFPGC